MHLLRMLPRVAAGARSAERPREQAHALDVPQRADVVDDGADVVPVRGDRRHRVCVARRARRGDEGRLTLPREVAGIGHRRRAHRPAVAGRVHREDVEAGLREKRHPAVVGLRDVEGDLGRRAGAVDEERHTIGARRAAQRRARQDALADVDRHLLTGDGPAIVAERQPAERQQRRRKSQFSHTRVSYNALA